MNPKFQSCGANFGFAPLVRSPALQHTYDHHPNGAGGRLARAGGLEELIAEVLPDNVAMLKVFEKSGLVVNTKHEAGVVHVTMEIA